MFAGTTPAVMDISSLKELSIGISAVVVIGLIVIQIVKFFLKEIAAQRDDFCKLMGNHIEHNTAAIEKNTEVLGGLKNVIGKLSNKLK